MTVGRKEDARTEHSGSERSLWMATAITLNSEAVKGALTIGGLHAARANYNPRHEQQMHPKHSRKFNAIGYPLFKIVSTSL
jgi:hypothetical protein